MSFKREGNDKGLLDNLRRRRVKELLGEDIPEDEAKLLCNGRFACLVCFHNPVFDTVNMLMVHRQGKKHAANEEIFLKKKKELKSLILKRKHEQYMKDGTTDIRQAVGSSTGGIMSTTQPYDPRTKRHKVKPYERKPCLDLHTESASSQLLAQPSVSAAVSDSGAFPADVPVKHSHQLKNIFRPAQRSPEPVRPYIRKNKTFTDNSTSFQPTHNAQHSLSVPSRDQNVSQTSACVSSQFSPLISSTSASPLSSSSHSSVTRVPGTCLGVNASSSSSSASHRAGTFTPPEPNLVKQSVHSSGTSQQSSGSFSNLCGTAGGREDGTGRASSVPQSVQARANPGHVGVGGSVENAAEKKQRAQKYYHLSGSGWKKDWDGKWIRDEDAEFDSDEEPPDLP